MPTPLDRQALEGSLAERPPKMYVQDLKTLEVLEAQYNPVSLERITMVDWTRLIVPGLSHRILHYNFTDNSKVMIELIYDAMNDGCTVSSLLHAANFMESVCYTKRGAQTVAAGQPSRVLFKWPSVLSLTCIVSAVKIKMERFNKRAQPTYLRLGITLEEIRDARLFSEDVLESGGERSGVTGAMSSGDLAIPGSNRTV